MRKIKAKLRKIKGAIPYILISIFVILAAIIIFDIQAMINSYRFTSIKSYSLSFTKKQNSLIYLLSI